MMFISVMLVLREVWYTKMLRDSQFRFNSAFHSLVDMVHLVSADLPGQREGLDGAGRAGDMVGMGLVGDAVVGDVVGGWSWSAAHGGR